ncbi:MAG: MFS transporter [Thermoguttaceae bacterium]|jgi:MFS family permease|nr:MFS transporter [Thermoguttaceae bacterium]
MSDPAPDPYAAWRNPSYRLYAAGWFAMTFGAMMEGVAIRLVVYQWTGDYLALGWIGLVRALPVLLLAIPGGQLADRLDRRRVVVFMLGLSLLVSLGLAAAVRWELPLAWIYVLLGIGAVSQALGGPSRAALLPQIVPQESFPNAVTWNTSVFQIASMTGPAAGGFLIDWAGGAAQCFLLVALCRLVSLASLAGVRYRAAERSGESVSLESLVAGVGFVWRNKVILATITLDLFAVLLAGVTYLLPVFAEDILNVGARGLGLLQSAEAAGAVAMAVLLAHRRPMRRAGRTLLWAVAGFGAATIVFGLSRWFPLSLAMMFVLGALDNISVVVRHTLVQMLTPDAMRGRVSAVNNIFIVASNDLGGVESGIAAHFLGPEGSAVLGGAGAIGVVIGVARVWPQILQIGALADVRPLEAAEAEERADEERAART